MNNEQGGRTGKPSQVRDLYQSLQHLQLQNPQNNAYENQSQSAFERPLGLQNTFSVLSEASAGDRRSYPRSSNSASSSAAALEDIRRDLQDMSPSTSSTMDYRYLSNDSDSSRSELNSSSFTDIPNMQHNYYERQSSKLKPNEQRRLLLSYGYDEVNIHKL